jgi:hypothetical protein
MVLVDFHEIQYGGHAIEGDLEAIVFNAVAAITIPKWRTLKLLRWMHNLHQSTWDDGILYYDRSSEYEQLSMSEISGSHGGEYEV